MKKTLFLLSFLCCALVATSAEPVIVTLCESELDGYDFGDDNNVTFTMSDFLSENNYVLDTNLTIAGVKTPYQITCYPTPAAKRSDDMPANPIKVISGSNYLVKYDLLNTLGGSSKISTSSTPETDCNTNVYVYTESLITSDKEFYITSLKSERSDCSATAKTLSDTIKFIVVEDVDVTLTVKDNIGGTLTDKDVTLPENGVNEKTYLITPADGYHLAKLEVGLEEYERANVIIENGQLVYKFTPNTDIELIACFEEIKPWNGTELLQPIGNGDTLYIYTPAELAWISSQTNNYDEDFAGKVIVLKNDIDLNNQTWGAIGTNTPFAGEFQANCHEIKNYDINYTSPTQGLFDQLSANGIVDGLPLYTGKIESFASDSIVCNAHDDILIKNLEALSGGDHATYLWKCNGEIIADSARSELVVKSGRTAGTYVFTRWIANNCETPDTLQSQDECTIIVREKFDAGEIETKNIVAATNYSPIKIGIVTPANIEEGTEYQWKENGVEINGAIEAIYTIPAGLGVGMYTYTREAKNDTYCETSFVASEGTFTLDVQNLDSVNVTLLANEFGILTGETKACTTQPNFYTLDVKDDCYVVSLESQVYGDITDSIYVANGQLVFSYMPTQSDVLTATFDSVPAWDGVTISKPFMTQANDTALIFTPAELIWIAEQLKTPATPASARKARKAKAPAWTQPVVLLENDLDCGGVYNVAEDRWSGAEWTPIGTKANPFESIFDGQGHEIKNLLIANTATDYTGLFGATANSAELKNFAITFGSISGKDYVGTVVGYNKGHIHHCYNMAEIAQANNYAGGIVGYNEGTIEYSYNVGLVATSVTNEYGGGIAGYNASTGTIQYVYCASDVWSSQKTIGALTGINDGTLLNSYWDNQMGISPTGDNKTVDKSVKSCNTSEMCNIFASDATNWVTTPKIYPQLVGLDGTDAALTSVAPIWLAKKKDGGFENVHSVKRDFALSLDNSVSWSTTSIAWLNIVNDSAKILYKNCYGDQVYIVAQRNNEIKRSRIRLVLDGDFHAGSINDTIEIACSIEAASPIAGSLPSGGNSETYVYEWRYTDENGDEHTVATDTTFTDVKREYKPLYDENGKKLKPGTYVFHRYAKDNACEQNYILCAGEWTLIVRPPFYAGEIETRKDTICIEEGVTPTMATINNVNEAAGGNKEQITYRWTIARLPAATYGWNVIAGSESPENTSYTPDISQLAPGTYTFMRQASDNDCADWVESDGCDTITIYDVLKAGEITSVVDSLICVTNANQTASLKVENKTVATGGKDIEYRWEITCSYGDTEIKEDNTTKDESITINFDMSTLENGVYPVKYEVMRYVHDDRCHTEWIESGNKATYIIGIEKESSRTINICSDRFPYDYTYTYRDGKKETVTFRKADDSFIFVDKTFVGCDSTVTISSKSTPQPIIEIVDSNLVICETDAADELWIQIQTVQGVASRYSLIYDDKAKAQGFVDVKNAGVPGSKKIVLKRPAGAKAQFYTVTLQVNDGETSCFSEEYKLTFAIALDGYLKQKWDDVIVVYNVGDDVHPLQFSAYQWYRNGEMIDGATQQHFYEENGLNGVYHVMLTALDGTVYRSCDFMPTAKAPQSSARIKVYPVPVRQNETMAIELPFAADLLDGGTLEICNAQGLQVYRTNAVEAQMLLTEHFAQGVYLIRFVDSQGVTNTAKFIVK